MSAKKITVLLLAMALLFCCIPVFALPIQAESVYNVRGVWYLNDTLDLSAFTTEHFEKVNVVITTNSYTYNCDRLCLFYSSHYEWVSGNFYDSSGTYGTMSVWKSGDYYDNVGYNGLDRVRIWNFGPEYQEVSGTFYNWLINNAVKSIHSVDISYEEKQYYPGMDVVFSCYVYGAGEYNSAVTWTVSGQNSENTTINSVNGLLSISSDETSYYLTVRATSVQDPSMYKEVHLSLRELPYPGDLVIVPESTEVSVGSSYELQFRVKYAGSESYIEGGEFFDHPELIWEVAGTPAEYFSITEDGLLLISDTAKAPAQAIVTVRYSWEDTPLFDMSSTVSLKHQDTSDQLGDVQDSLDKLPGQITDGIGDIMDQEKDEADSAGNEFVDQILDALPDPSTDVLAALKSLTDATAYTGTDAILPIPGIVLPGIDGLFPATEIWGGMDLNFGDYIGLLPASLLSLAQNLFTIAIVLYCVYELKNIISFIFTLNSLNKGGVD